MRTRNNDDGSSADRRAKLWIFARSKSPTPKSAGIHNHSFESQGRVVFTSAQFTGTYGLEAQQVLGADIVPKLAIPMPW